MRFPPSGVSCDIQNWQGIAMAVLPGRLESRRLARVPEFQFLRFRYPRRPIAKGLFAAGKVGFQGLACRWKRGAPKLFRTTSAIRPSTARRAIESDSGGTRRCLLTVDEKSEQLDSGRTGRRQLISNPLTLSVICIDQVPTMAITKMVASPIHMAPKARASKP